MKAFIDESGDPGMGPKRGSRWLVYGCVLVSQSRLKKVGESVESAFQWRFSRGSAGKVLHFGDMTHEVKLRLLDHYLTSEWEATAVARDTDDVSLSSLARSTCELCFKLLGFLLERVSRRAGIIRETVEVNIEESGTVSKDGHLLDWLRKEIASGRLVIDGRWLPIENISIVPKERERLLCLADALAHATFRALEKDRHSLRTEEGYILKILDRFWKEDKEFSEHGLLIRPKRIPERFLWTTHARF